MNKKYILVNYTCRFRVMLYGNSSKNMVDKCIILW